MPTPSSRTSLPRTKQRSDDEERGRGEVGRDGELAQLESLGGLDVTRFAGSSPWMVTEVPWSVVLTRAPAARSIRSVWSRVGRCSITAVSPSASSPASSRHDFTWALATGIRYSIPVAAHRADPQRGQPFTGLDVRPHLTQRIGDPVDRAPADRLVAVEDPLPHSAGPRASPAAGAEAFRRCRRRCVAEWAPRRPTPRIAMGSAPPIGPRHRRRRLHRESSACRQRRGSCAIDRLALAHRRDDRRAVGDRLVGWRDASVPRSDPAGSNRVIRRRRARA